MAKYFTYKLTNNLSKLPIAIKISFLVIGALALYLPHIFLNKIGLDHYFIGYAVGVCLLSISCYLIIGAMNFKIIFKLWAIGTLVYACFAIPRIYLSGMLTPYFNLITISDRWLYSLLLPLTLLGTFSVGLIFVRITSPLDFLKWGATGKKIALLLRVLQHSMQILNDTKIALMMQDKWPEESGLFNVRKTWQMLKYCPLLIGTALRNIIIYWFPWGMACFKQKMEK